MMTKIKLPVSKRGSMLIVCFSLIVSSQAISHTRITGKVIEKGTQLPVSFASVLYQNHSTEKSMIADVQGEFVLNEEAVGSITVSCVGYKSNRISIKSGKVIVELENEAVQMSEIVIRASDNPAIRIIKKVLANKKTNNYENYDRYSFRCYFKTIYDIKSAGNAAVVDSQLLRRSKMLQKHALFISESVVSSLHIRNRTENKIIATKTSGFKDPTLGQEFFEMFHNSISFYNNTISLFEIPFSTDKSVTDYVGPLSDGCLNGYNYQLEDSFESQSDSIFVINFFPKRGTNFNSLTGRLYISSNGYAIKNIVAEPSEKGLIDFRFRQDYEYLANKWFPTRLDEEIKFIALKKGKLKNAYPVYLITSRIDSVNYAPHTDLKSVNLEKVYLDRNSIRKSDSILVEARYDSLTRREKNTYQAVDSLGSKHHFDTKLNFMNRLMFGRVPLRYSEIDLNRVYSYNDYEGSRFGIGLYSNDKVSGFLSFGGFAGYGERDKHWKYGGQLDLDLNKYNEVHLNLSYQYNLKEAGLDLIGDYSRLSLSEYLRSYIGSRFDNCIEKKLDFSFRTLRFLKVTATLSIKNLTPMYDYRFKGVKLENYRSDDVQIGLRYAYGEELTTLANRRVSNYEGNPVLNFTYRRGIDLLNSKSYTYNRMEATVDVTAYKGRIGQSHVRLAAGLIDKSLPYGLLFTGEGSKSFDVPLMMDNTFQTMYPNEFLSDHYVNLFCSHNFGTLLLNTPKFKPQFVIVQNCGVGTLENSSDQGIDFKEKNKIYLESGLIINNLIKLKYLDMFYVGVGVGAFYRYGYYGYNAWQDNLALKGSFTLTFK